MNPKSLLKRILPSRTETEDEDEDEFADLPETEGIDVTEFFRVVSSSRRRFVCLAVWDSDRRKCELGELAVTLAARENDKHRDNVLSDERKRCYVGLYQTHLPTMDELGLVDYNSDRGTVEPGPNLEAVITEVRRVEAMTGEDAMDPDCERFDTSEVIAQT